MVDIHRIEKAQGALLASAIGDALGWPYELNSGNQNRGNNKESRFQSWKRKNRYPFWYTETIEKGCYSDDTQLILAVARCLVCGNWVENFTNVEYPFWLEYERGAGRAVKKAAMSWKKGIIPWKARNYSKDYFGAGGNGGAMRILPHVIRMQDDDLRKVIDEVITDVIISHGHPRAILGATCYAYALYYLLNKQGVLDFAKLVDELIEGRKVWGAAPNKSKFYEWLEIAQNESGYNYSTEWNNCYTSLIKSLDYIKQALNDGLLSDDRIVLENIGAYSKVSGAGDVAALAAVYFFSKYVNTPELAISLPAFSVGIDTDTIASMTGGLIGAFCGNDWIPLEWKSVQDYSYICSIASKLCENMQKESKIEEYLLNDIKQMSVLNSVDIDSKYSVVTITGYKTILGQTIYIKTVDRKTVDRKAEEKQARKSTINNDWLRVSVSQIENIINDDELSRITLRKAFDIVFMKYQGFDKEKIAKKLKIKDNLVLKVLTYFEQE